MTGADTVKGMQIDVKRCPECGTGFGFEAAFCPFDGIQLATSTWDPTRDPLTGTVVDRRYEVIAPLGEGGMGSVWGDRYHRRDLTTPREVRHALVYVLGNHLKHREPNVGLLDPLSSGPWFDGWMHMREPPPTEAAATHPADTWLLREGWYLKGGGFIHLGERPKAARGARA